MRSCSWLFFLALMGTTGIITGWWKIQEVNEVAEPLSSGQGLDEDVAALLKAASQDGEIILMAATKGYIDFAMNTVCRLQQLQILNFAVLALDDETKEFFEERNMPVLRSTILGTQRRYGFLAKSLYSKEFNLIAREKHVGALACLYAGLKVFLLDVDVFLLQDPMKELRRMSEQHDFVFQSDAKLADASNYYLNSGFYYVKPSQPAIDTLVQVLKETLSGQNQEQTVLHNLVCGVGQEYATNGTHCFNPKTGCRSVALERKMFVHGYSLTRDASATSVMSWKPYSIHFNWLEGKENKMIAMRMLGMWIIDEQSTCSKNYSSKESLELASNFDNTLTIS